MFSCVIKTFITYPNGHTMSNQHQFDIDIISICQRENIDKCPHHFDVIFHCDFIGQKISVVLTYFPRRNVHGQKIDVVFMYFLQRNFDGKKIDVVSTYFARRNFDEWKIDIVSTFVWSNFDRKKKDVVSMYFLMQFWWKTDVTSKCWFWLVFERQKLVAVMQFLFKMFLIYQKLQPFELQFWT